MLTIRIAVLECGMGIRRTRGRTLPALRFWRERRALAQRELAEAAELTEATISRLETGRRGAFPSTVRRLASVLLVTPAQLYGEHTDG